MSKRNRRADPSNPAQSLGQSYVPHDPYYYITGGGRFRYLPSFWIFGYGCLVLGSVASVAVIFVSIFLAMHGLPSWVLAVGAVAVALLIMGVVATRRFRKTKKAPRHHKRHNS